MCAVGFMSVGYGKKYSIWKESLNLECHAPIGGRLSNFRMESPVWWMSF